MPSVVYYDSCLSYQMIIKTRHNKLCVVTPWLFQRTNRSGTKACFCLDQCFSNFFISSPAFHSRHVVFAPQAW